MDQLQHDQTTLASGMRVLLRAFDEIPEHQFGISEVYDDCIGGYSLSRAHWPENTASQSSS